ncbi:DUF805 domain-containing protein (plasmid) [Enterococcus faecalis]
MENLLNYKAKMNRLDFWKAMICLFLIGFVLEGMARLIYNQTLLERFYWEYLFLNFGDPIIFNFLKILMLFVILTSFYFQTKRIRATGLPLWIVLLNFVPFVEVIPNLICLFKKSATVT